MDCVICKTGMSHLMRDLHICESCGLVSSSIAPDVSIYDKSYAIKYKRYETTKTGEQIQSYRLGVVEKFVDSGDLLDFGCGVGSFVNVCQGYRARGFDINPYSKFTDITALFGDIDIVTMWDSLEHVSNPVALLNGLKPSWVFISTPDTDGYPHHDLTRWKHYMPHEHVHYFNSGSLSRLLAVCGYKHIFTDHGESKFRVGGGDKNIITVGGKLG